MPQFCAHCGHTQFNHVPNGDTRNTACWQCLECFRFTWTLKDYKP